MRDSILKIFSSVCMSYPYYTVLTMSKYHEQFYRKRILRDLEEELRTSPTNIE